MVRDDTRSYLHDGTELHGTRGVRGGTCSRTLVSELDIRYTRPSAWAILLMLHLNRLSLSLISPSVLSESASGGQVAVTVR